MPGAREELKNRLGEISNLSGTELAVYKMSTEPVSPDWPEVFYMGMVVSRVDRIPDGMEHLKLPPITFVQTTVKGPINRISEAYQALHHFLKDKGYIADQRSYLVELYDERFDLESAESEMEIYFPIVVERVIY